MQAKYFLSNVGEGDEGISELNRRAAVITPACVGMVASALTPALDPIGGAMLGGLLACALPLAITSARIQIMTVKIALGLHPVKW